MVVAKNSSVGESGSLCVRCGLCCDGSLFADVELRDEAEAVTIEALGLEVEEEDGRELLLQPCRALRGKICGIYAHRPECCRTFECRLLKDFLRGDVDLAGALVVVDKLRGLLAGGGRADAETLIDERFLKSE